MSPDLLPSVVFDKLRSHEEINPTYKPHPWQIAARADFL